MKIFLLILLCASLAANALLFKNRHAQGSSAAGSSKAGEKSAAVSAPALSADNWELIKTGDATSLEKLRELGLSDEIARNVVRARVELRYREREQALITPGNYWHRSYTTSLYRPDPLKSLDLRREKEAELKAAIGDDYRKNDDYTDPRTAFLPRDKAEDLRLLQEDYDALTQSTYTYDGSIMLPEDREKLAYLEKQKRADLTALLTPEELAQYDLRNSNTAAMLTLQLRDSDFTEEEYKTIFALRKPFDDQFTNMTMSGAATMITTDSGKARQQAEEALESQIKTALGDQRYADYQRAKDTDYKTISKLATRLELPPAKAIEAYNLKVSIEEKLKTFRPVPGTPPAQQRAEFLAGLNKEAETGFTQLLGAKGYTAYKDSSQLFRRLTPPTPPPPAPSKS